MKSDIPTLKRLLWRIGGIVDSQHYQKQDNLSKFKPISQRWA
ncbi:hypothetical protein LPE509_01876 [Legionella pneumophila subsp. pneumophila LPE509]|nr:hypothetical protein LPE509_01876 [Legionella pneumophila subsp. pneumophila LPE509]